jgi:hypothetical protein
VEPVDQRRALAVCLVVATAVAWPTVSWLAGGSPDDSFPLSTYPMFARDRGEVVELSTVVGVDATGDAHRLSPSTIAGTDQVIQAVVAVERAIAGGGATSLALCEEVAGRVDDADFERVEVVVERYDVIAWSGCRDEPLDRRVIRDCDVS